MDTESVCSLLSDKAKAFYHVSVKQVVTSTNDVLRQEARQGASQGTALCACQQTGGKGRMGRSFFSPPDTGLYLSVLVRPSFPAVEALLLTTGACVATARAVEQVTGRKTQIKWVNDLLLNGRKVTGILTESVSGQAGTDPVRKEAKLSFAVIGIGVNIWEPEGGFPGEIASTAGALYPHDAPRADSLRSRLAAGILNEFCEIYQTLPSCGFMEEYRKRSCLVGKRVRYQSPLHTPIPGAGPVTVTGIGDHAELLAIDDEGHRHVFRSGEISLLDVPGG